MIKELRIALSIEQLKMKRTNALLLSIIAPIFLASLFFCIYYFSGYKFLVKETNGFEHYIGVSTTSGVGILFPLFIILLVGLINNIEYKANSFKQSFCFPLSKGSIILSKIILSQGLILLSTLLFYVLSIIAATIISWKIPDLFQVNFQLFQEYFILMITIFFSSILLSAIQFFLSINWSQLVFSLAVGMAGFISAMVLLRGWKYINFHPYALPITSTQTYLKQGELGLFSYEILYSLIFGAIIYTISYFQIRKRKILNT
jgi:hypothetical protein